MRAIIACLTLLMSIPALAQIQIRTQQFSDTELHGCRQNQVGCRPSLKLGNQFVPIDVETLPQHARAALNEHPVVEIEDQVEGFFNQTFKFVLSSGASISACNSNPSCVPKINVRGEEVLIDVNTVTQQNARRIFALSEDAEVQVKGFFALETGHFPTPYIPVRVFKLIELRFSEEVIAQSQANNRSPAIDDTIRSMVTGLDSPIPRRSTSLNPAAPAASTRR